MMIYSKVQSEKECQKSICFVMRWHPDYRIGGSEIQAWLLAKALARRGWRVHYVSEYDVPPEWGAVRDGVHIHGFKIRKNIERVHLDLLRYVAFSRLLRKIDADIYYQRCADTYTGMTAYFARSNKKRFMWASAHVQECKKNIFTYPLNKYNGHGLRKAIVLLVARLNDRSYLHGIKNASKVLAQAEYQQKLLRENFGRESVIIKNCHHVPAKLPQKDNPPIVLWLASLKRWKQAEIFIKLARRHKDLDCRFILAGRASGKEYFAEILKQMQGLSNIENVGGVTFEESNDLIGRASVFVNTSTYEGFPNTFIQAWMRGVPVVSLNVDPDDILSHESIGFKSGTFENLCRDVMTLIGDKDMRDTMGQRARLYAISNHSIEAVTDKFLSVIQSIL